MSRAPRIYWRPWGLSRTTLILICLLSVAGMAAVEFIPRQGRQPYYAEKLRAAKLARHAMQTVKNARAKRSIPINSDADPAQTGLIGEVMTPTTSSNGSLPAKQVSVNPNFAAVLVEMLKAAGVREGDSVAVGCSGSFPALNICTYAALATLGARPIVIASAAASQWGANRPDFLWIDMEKVLYEQKVFPFRSATVSIGGVQDRGVGLSAEGRRMILAAVERSSLPLLKVKGFDDSIAQRMALYQDHAGGGPIKAYISIGGGTTSVGKRAGKKLFHPGLNVREPVPVMPADSVMARFLDEGIPTIHLVQIQQLAAAYGLPAKPAAALAEPGEGGIYYHQEYNPWLAAGALTAIILALYTCIRQRKAAKVF